MLEPLLTEEQHALRDEVRAFVQSVPRQLLLDMDADRVRYPREYLVEGARRRDNNGTAAHAAGRRHQPRLHPVHGKGAAGHGGGADGLVVGDGDVGVERGGDRVARWLNVQRRHARCCPANGYVQAQGQAQADVQCQCDEQSSSFHLSLSLNKCFLAGRRPIASAIISPVAASAFT